MFSRFSRYVTFGDLNHRNSRYISASYIDRGQCQFRKSSTWTETKPPQTSKIAHMLKHGAIPLLDTTVGQLLGQAAATWPERICCISSHQNLRITYRDLLRRVDAFAAGLKKLGMKKGDRLGIWGPNDLEWLITSFSASRAGLITVAINPAYQLKELVYSLQKVRTKVIVAPASFKTQNYPKMLLAAKETCPFLEHIIVYSPDHVSGTRRFVDVEALATKTEMDAIAFEQDDMSCYDGFNIQFTSGSTGKPKATFLSHRSIVNNSKQALNRLETDIDSKICVNVPFFHAFSLIMVQTLFLHKGNTVVLEERSFNPVKSLETIAREKCTIMYGTPTMWVNLLDAQKRLQLPMESLRLGAAGGSPVPPEVFRRIREILRFDNIMDVYGLTETSGIIFQSILGEDKSLTDHTVGQVSDHVEVMITDDAGQPVPFGTPGELWVRGYCNMLHYWEDEENTIKTITKDGWLKTGDQMILRENGYGSIVGRYKDMIIRGGENIFPREIENFLMTHPAVLEAQVIGAYDTVYGEEICACILLRDGEKVTKDELKNYCRGKIAHFKIPRYVEFLNEFPKTASGKIQKFNLRNLMESKGAIPTTPNCTNYFK